jgi:hypothetical protein
MSSIHLHIYTRTWHMHAHTHMHIYTRAWGSTHDYVAKVWRSHCVLYSCMYACLITLLGFPCMHACFMYVFMLVCMYECMHAHHKKCSLMCFDHFFFSKWKALVFRNSVKSRQKTLTPPCAETCDSTAKLMHKSSKLCHTAPRWHRISVKQRLLTRKMAQNMNYNTV